ncbi:DUF29 domain-containing protein [Rhodopseudomonas palustris]|uniref:DUF29 domain-containing protein n=1 Tax=Rhodopseudomonas palustris TaxID=1076 RepID=A0A323UGD0_RHOPL|nr:DUF29 domain-containing protein [Rhodopseudomonas palustris]PZA11594.1 DUF29 domain-containing protein [Rhodopseudomonas palustris]
MTTTKSKLHGDPIEPATPKASRGYREDLYGWVQDQVALLRAGRLSDIDAVNIADELGDVGRTEYDKLQSAIRIVLLHLLKWDHQPERRSRSGVLSIREHRRWIGRLLRDNPSLQPRISEGVAEAYEDAVDDAVKETGLTETAFPATCPYDWHAVVERVIEHDELQSPRRH